MGIVSTLCLTAVIFIDGFSKTAAPGSLIEPAETHLLFANWKNLGMAFGLFMAGFGAHAAMPSLAADMEDPPRFDEAMDYAFTFTTFFYALIGAAGYLMFGDDVSDEVSKRAIPSCPCADWSTDQPESSRRARVQHRAQQDRAVDARHRIIDKVPINFEAVQHYA